MEVAEGPRLTTLAFSPMKLTVDFSLQSAQSDFISLRPSTVVSGYGSHRKPTGGFGSCRPHQAREGKACPCEGQVFSGPVPRCAPQGHTESPAVVEWVGEPVQLCRLCPWNSPGGSGSRSSSRVCGMFPSNYPALGSDAPPSLSAGKTSASERGSGRVGSSPAQCPWPTVTPRRAGHVSHESPLLCEAQGH